MENGYEKLDTLKRHFRVYNPEKLKGMLSELKKNPHPTHEQKQQINAIEAVLIESL